MHNKYGSHRNNYGTIKPPENIISKILMFWLTKTIMFFFVINLNYEFSGGNTKII